MQTWNDVLWISDDHKRWCKIAMYPLRCTCRGRDTIPTKSHLWPRRRKQPDKWTWCPAEVWKEDESEMLAGCLAPSLRITYKHPYTRTVLSTSRSLLGSAWGQFYHGEHKDPCRCPCACMLFVTMWTENLHNNAQITHLQLPVCVCNHIYTHGPKWACCLGGTRR